MGCMYYRACVAEDNFRELVLALYHVGSGAQTQVIRFGSKCFYLLVHLDGYKSYT